MRVVGWLGIACIMTAYAIGAIHLSFTGDDSIRTIVLQGILAASVMALLVGLRLGLPAHVRAWRIKRALRPRAPQAR